MRIGVMSDTHGGLKSWNEIMAGVFCDVDVILHAGDIFYHGIRNPLPEGYDTINLVEQINTLKTPLIVCRGNCDSEVDQLVVDIPIQSPYCFCQFEGLKFLLHHGHGLSESEVVRLASRWSLGLVISGHTHVAGLEQKEKLVFLNPGSHALPKGDGIPTVALIEHLCGKEMTTTISILDYQHGNIIQSLMIR